MARAQRSYFRVSWNKCERTSPEALSSFSRTWRKVRRYLAATLFSGRRRRLRHPRYVPWKEENSGNPGEERRFRWEGDGGVETPGGGGGRAASPAGRHFISLATSGKRDASAISGPTPTPPSTSSLFVFLRSLVPVPVPSPSGPVHPRGARRRPGSSFHPRPRANRVLPLPLSDILLSLPFVPPFPPPPRHPALPSSAACAGSVLPSNSSATPVLPSLTLPVLLPLIVSSLMRSHWKRIA